MSLDRHDVVKMAQSMGSVGFAPPSGGSNDTSKTQQNPFWQSPPGNITVNHFTYKTTHIKNQAYYNSHQTISSSVPHPSPSYQQSSTSSSASQGWLGSLSPSPAPGQMMVCNALVPRNGTYECVPALCYASAYNDSRYVYPFTRQRLGDVWYTPKDFWSVELHIANDPTLKYIATRIDLPLAMVRQIVTGLEKHGGGAYLDLQRLQMWKAEMHSPFGYFMMDIPCLTCGRVNAFRFADVKKMTNIDKGLLISNRSPSVASDPRPVAHLH